MCDLERIQSCAYLRSCRIRPIEQIIELGLEFLGDDIEVASEFVKSCFKILCEPFFERFQIPSGCRQIKILIHRCCTRVRILASSLHRSFHERSVDCRGDTEERWQFLPSDQFGRTQNFRIEFRSSLTWHSDDGIVVGLS